MTGQLYTRLTQPADPARRTHVDYTVVESYTYTPRKPLRRVLDHTLDHLNQIEQWQRWRQDGVVPTPTDGWVGSTVTLPEDRLPLTPSDLEAWLWRIDLAMGLMVQRTARLAEEELDWQPPDGGWAPAARPAPRRPIRGALRRVIRRGAARGSRRSLCGR